MHRQLKRILLIRTDRIGDLVLSTPAIENLRRAYPRAYIACICRQYTKEVLENNPFLNEVIVYEKEGRHHSWWQTIRFARNVARKDFDAAFILHASRRAHLIALLAGIPVRIGWDRKTAWALTRRVPHRKWEGAKHESEYTLDLLRASGIPVKETRLYFSVSEEAKRKAKRMLETKGLSPNQEYFAVHLSASCPAKQWPFRNFFCVMEKVHAHSGLAAVVIGSGSDSRGKSMFAPHPWIIDLRGETTLKETGAVLSRARILITNDSGPAHIAAALGVPVVSLFGYHDPALSPVRWRPLGEGSKVLHKDVGCEVCAGDRCLRDYACIRAITPEEVFDSAHAVLAQPSGSE
ncbi:MAG: lipopolysaccharide heptosyltransferase II [Candidatus Omnitrophica bacterium]|nr:lipopolysaccharide heptosyltransferase II [Candidatus Omnitrophota bacterium]